MITARSYLGKMRYAEHLMIFGYLVQLAAHNACSYTAYARVYLIKYESRYMLSGISQPLECKRYTGYLTAGRYF